MQIIDYVIIGITAVGLIIGLVRGFIGQLLALLGIVAIAVGTSYLFKYPQQWLAGVISNEKVATIVAIIVTAIVLAIVYGIIAHFVKRPFKSIKVIKAVDKILGGVLGVAVVYALFALFIEALTRTDIEFMAKLNELVAPYMENSVVVNTVYANNFFGKWIMDVISNGISQAFPQAHLFVR